MAEPMDDLLRELGQGAPFPVDWTEYEQALMRRLFLQQAARRKRAWWGMLASAAAGSVATLVLAVSFVGKSQTEAHSKIGKQVEHPPRETEPSPTETRPVQEPVNVPAESQGQGEFVRIIQRENGSLARMSLKADAFKPEIVPFSSKSRRTDGTTSQIRFGGFSGPDAAPPTAIGAVRK